MKRMATMYSTGPWNQPPISNPTTSTTALMIETVFEQSSAPNLPFCVSMDPSHTEDENFEDSEKALLELVTAIEAESKSKPIRNQHPMVTRSHMKESKPEGANISDLGVKTNPNTTISPESTEEQPTQSIEPNRTLNEESKQVQALTSTNTTSPIRYTMKSSAEIHC